MPVTAKINEIYVRDGSKVEEGQTLATLDAESLMEEYENLYEEWLEAKSQLGNMKPSYTYTRIIATQEGKVTENNLSKDKNTEDIIREKEYLLAIESDGLQHIYSDDVPKGKISSVNYLSAVGRQVKSGDLLFIVKVEDASFRNQVEVVENLENELKLHKTV